MWQKKKLLQPLLNEEKINHIKNQYDFTEDYDLFGKLNELIGDIPMVRMTHIPDLSEKKEAFKKLEKRINSLIDFIRDLPCQIQVEIAKAAKNCEIFAKQELSLIEFLRDWSHQTNLDQSKLDETKVEFEKIYQNYNLFFRLSECLTAVQTGCYHAIRKISKVNIQIKTINNNQDFQMIFKDWKGIEHINKILFVKLLEESTWEAYWCKNFGEPIKRAVEKGSDYEQELNRAIGENPIFPSVKNIKMLCSKNKTLFGQAITERVGSGGPKFEYINRVIITRLLHIFKDGTTLDPTAYRKEAYGKPKDGYDGNFYNFLVDLRRFIKYSKNSNIGEIAIEVVKDYKKKSNK